MQDGKVPPSCIFLDSPYKVFVPLFHPYQENTNMTQEYSASDSHRNQNHQQRAAFICFLVSNDKNVYGINVYRVKEVCQRSDFVVDRPCRMHAHVDGTILHRGEVIPVINLAKWLNREDAENETLLVCHFNRTTIALIVGGQPWIIRKEWSEIERMKQFEDSGQVTYITKTTVSDDKGGELLRVVFILDMESLLQELFPGIDIGPDSIEPLTESEQTKKVLIAEDSMVARNEIKKTLDAMGLTNHAFFSNGDDLMNHIKNASSIEDIGIIITDLEMPGSSGYDIIPRLQGDERTKNIPVLVCSSMASGGSIETEARRLGAVGFVEKRSPREMAEKIRQFLLP